MPMSENMVIAIMHKMRLFLTYVDVIEMIARPVSWKIPFGIWTRRELSGLKPNPFTIMLLNLEPLSADEY
jgi:hypothetical protein